jgi:FKBP-type peptidyl-prolyl cis-trans isomerase
MSPRKQSQRTNKNQKRNVTPVQPPVKKSKFRKLLTILSVLALLAVVGFFCYLFFGNNYKENARQVKLNSIVASRLAGQMLADYQENWIRVETEKLGKNAKGDVVSTSDPAQVLAWRKQCFQENGCLSVLDSLVKDIDKRLDKMGMTPAKYKDVNESFKSLAQDVKDLQAMVLTPGDSLLEMSSKMSQLLITVGGDLDKSDFDFFVNYEDVNEKIQQVESSIKDKTIVERLAKDASTAQNSAINAIKYRQQGFKELPGGKGVLYKEITKGKGPKAKDDTNVRVHYEGKLMDGTIFDSSYQRGQSTVMRPQQTVPGFWHSLTSMQVGSKWQIFIPYAEAYGDKASGAIKPYSDLEFTIEVIGFE